MIALPLALCLTAAALLYRWLRCVGWSRGERLRWAIAWAPAFAFGIPSCALFAARWCGLDGALPWSLVALGLVAAFALAARREWQSGPAARLPERVAAGSRAGGGPSPRGKVAVRAATAGLLAVTALLLLSTFRTWQRAQPDGMWDAVAIWNADARFLARAESARLPEIFGAQREGHPEYPLLLGAAVAAQWELASDESSAVPLGMSLGFAIGLAAALHLLVRTCGAPLFAGPAVLLVFSTPVVWKWAFAQVADLPLAYLALAAALPLVARLQDCTAPKAPPALSGFVLGLLPWTKPEGALMAATLLLLFLALRLPRGGDLGAPGGEPQSRSLRRPLGFALGALPGVLSLFLFKSTWAPLVPERAAFLRGSGKIAKLLDFERWRLVAAESLRHFDPRTGDALWGFAWLLLGIGLLFWGGRLRWRTAPGAVLLSGAAVATFTFYALAFVLSPYDLAWHLSSALDRLLLHVLPLVAAAVFGLAGTDTSGEHRVPPANQQKDRGVRGGEIRLRGAR